MPAGSYRQAMRKTHQPPASDMLPFVLPIAVDAPPRRQSDPSARRKAIEAGKPRYFTGLPCKHGHISDRWVDGACVKCTQQRRSRGSQASRGKTFRRSDGTARQKALKEGKTRYFSGIPCKHGHIAERDVSRSYCVECSRLSRQMRQSDRARRLRDKYKLTLVSLEKMRKVQAGCCALCGDTFADNPQKMHIDHCHISQKVRGLLCADCNIGLGRFRDDPKRLRLAIKYLANAGRGR